jgi:mono/diheme cytochrome c family protein
LAMPVKGTIPRGFTPYAYPNTPEGYAASDSNKNPLTVTPQLQAQGEVLYGKFCVHCHGASGAGDGAVGAKLPGAPPSYLSPAIIALSDGKMFHSISYGKGLMGAHASMLTQQERWELILYIKKLQLAGAPAPVVADSTQIVKK